MKYLSQISKVFSYTRLLTTLFIIIITFFIFSSVYTVKDGEVGVLRTFGKVTDFTNPGLHLKFPYPIQEVDVLSINRTNIIEIGFNKFDNSANKSQNFESISITADNSIVSTDLVVEWRIVDPYSYLFKAKNPEHILKNLIISSLKSTIGRLTIDSILTDGKLAAQNSIKKEVEEELKDYDLGIEVLHVKIVDAQPPEDIKSSFEAVEGAIEQKNILINKAEEYKAQKINAAEGEANKIIKEAEAYYEERINKAKSETDIFNSIYKEYKMSKEVTKSRMLIETLEEVLPGANIYIMDTKEGTLNYFTLPKEKGGNQ
ncbi:MAG: FtsH protease activity modulator HflK [Lutispora sp.]|jgi:membrane protease subunit HflK|uniref:FtsH protease activity modulator HflK n=1 Tax=Lutispora sp. TaxID=2828727 RepID=UPI0035682165